MKNYPRRERAFTIYYNRLFSAHQSRLADRGAERAGRERCVGRVGRSRGADRAGRQILRFTVSPTEHDDRKNRRKDISRRSIALCPLRIAPIVVKAQLMTPKLSEVTQIIAKQQLIDARKPKRRNTVSIKCLLTAIGRERWRSIKFNCFLTLISCFATKSSRPMRNCMGLSQIRTCGSSHPAPPALSPLETSFIVKVSE